MISYGGIYGILAVVGVDVGVFPRRLPFQVVSRPKLITILPKEWTAFPPFFFVWQEVVFAIHGQFNVDGEDFIVRNACVSWKRLVVVVQRIHLARVGKAEGK